jgi:hypothetical protein
LPNNVYQRGNRSSLRGLAAFQLGPDPSFWVAVGHDRNPQFGGSLIRSRDAIVLRTRQKSQSEFNHIRVRGFILTGAPLRNTLLALNLADRGAYPEPINGGQQSRAFSQTS